jgi:hypothetical protein
MSINYTSTLHVYEKGLIIVSIVVSLELVKRFRREELQNNVKRP